MNRRFVIHLWQMALACALTAGIGCSESTVVQSGSPSQDRASTQTGEPVQDPKLLDSPEQAMQALQAATAANDRKALIELFGAGIRELASGDEVQDSQDFANFARRLAKASKLVGQETGSCTILVGVDEYPFPVPIVKTAAGKWHFDTASGIDEIISRRVGEHELNVIRVCKGYVAAQLEYLTEDRDGDGVIEYAQRFASTPGQRDGLYWDTAPGEPLSPLGPLAAEAAEEGYVRRTDAASTEPRPYHGYLFKILTRQGRYAPGGRFDYIINGNMVAGFAMVAWPVDWSSSGVMTFVVGPNGKVYQKNLGEKTSELAAALTTFDPDGTWQPAEK